MEKLSSLEAKSIEESESVPLEDGVDRFREKEDEETPLPILNSGSRIVTFTKDDIVALRLEDIMVEDDNDPDPEKVFHSGDVLPAPKTLNSGFQGIVPWL